MNTESLPVGSQEHLLERGQKEYCQASQIPWDCRALPHLPPWRQLEEALATPLCPKCCPVWPQFPLLIHLAHRTYWESHIVPDTIEKKRFDREDATKTGKKESRPRSTSKTQTSWRSSRLGPNLKQIVVPWWCLLSLKLLSWGAVRSKEEGEREKERGKNWLALGFQYNIYFLHNLPEN